LGGGKGGSDFDPKGKSDAEIMRFCQSFMTELSKYIGADKDVPAGDIGVGDREIGYMFGQYKRLRDTYEGALTGKSVVYGGSLIRKQATGYGLVYFTQNVLNHHGDDISGKKVCVSGAGNVAIHAAEKAQQLGCKVLTLSDSKGWIYDAEGVDLKVIKNIKEVMRKDLSLYIESRPNAKYYSGKFKWTIPCDVALPCATQNEVDAESVQNLIKNSCKIICEGANMPLTSDALKIVLNSDILYAPGKASNAGGVAVSGLEMSQNSMRLKWTAEEVDEKLKDIMKGIFVNISEAAAEYGEPNNYLMGANICGFKRVAEAIIRQGAV
ncbi:MAG: NADP-specific glutamate dehydrogenase, partial [Clostridia bacterium]|nr:NADP-specific glutamate dehydrogenase [Clostridia bacterium]